MKHIEELYCLKKQCGQCEEKGSKSANIFKKPNCSQKNLENLSGPKNV